VAAPRGRADGAAPLRIRDAKPSSGRMRSWRGVVLVLNQNYEPLNVCNLPRAFRLVFGERAEVLEYDHQLIRTPRADYRAPAVIRLQHQIRRPRPACQADPPRGLRSRRLTPASTAAARPATSRWTTSSRAIAAAPMPGTTWSRPAKDAITARAGSSWRRRSYGWRADPWNRAATCTRSSPRTCATTATRPGARTSSLATELGRD